MVDLNVLYVNAQIMLVVQNSNSKVLLQSVRFNVSQSLSNFKPIKLIFQKQSWFLPKGANSIFCKCYKFEGIIKRSTSNAETFNTVFLEAVYTDI